MSSATEVGDPVLEGLDDQALLGLAKQTLTAVGANPLDGNLGDAELAESVGRLHELETIVAAEKLRRIAAGAILSSARRGAVRVSGRRRICWRGGCG